MLDERIGKAIDDIAWRDTIHAFAHRFLLQLFHVLLLEVLNVLTIIEAHLLYQAHAGLLGWFNTCQYGENAGDTQRVWSDMYILKRTLLEQFFVNLNLIRDPQVVRNFDQNNPVLIFCSWLSVSST